MRKLRPPGQERSLVPWFWVCGVLIAVLLIVQFALPHHPAADMACQLGAHRC